MLLAIGYTLLNTEDNNYGTYRVVKKKGNPLLAAILKYFLEVINLSVYIFGKFRLFYVIGEEIVDKDARISPIRLFEHIR